MFEKELEELTQLENLGNDLITQYNSVKKQINSKKKDLLKKCSHTNITKHRDDGIYGEKYQICNICKQIL